MNKKSGFEGSFRKNKLMYKFLLSMYLFEEDHVQIVYSPALDLSGYGKNEREARQSFEEAFKEFINYSTNKNTLIKELRKLGWHIPLKNLSMKNYTAHK